MITTAFANQFAQAWLDSWNSHNVESILDHYTDDFVIETPMASKLIPESKGTVKGKVDLKKYWLIGLERIPHLQFKIIDTLLGVNSLSVYYINTATNKKSVEVMSFNNEHKVNRVIVNYSEQYG